MDISTPAISATIPGARKSSVEPSSGGMTVLLMMNGTAETATNITTTPLTVGVNIRRSEARRNVSTDCTRVETTTKLANKPGPPTWSAKAQTAKNGTLKFATTRLPEPKCRNRSVWRIMPAPVTARTVNITHDR